MTAAQALSATVDETFIYRRRVLMADPVVEAGGWSVKPYRIGLQDPAALQAVRAEPLADLLRQAFADKDLVAGHRVGFAVLHRGRDGTYLLVAHWVAGHNLASRTFQVVDGPDGGRRLEPFHLFACVWEMGVYAFESEAWIETAMRGGGSREAISAYLAARREGEI